MPAKNNLSGKEKSKTKSRKPKGRNGLDYVDSILETLMESSVDLIFLKDLDGKYIEVNAEFCKFVEVSREEIIGNEVDLFFDTAQTGKINESDQRVLKTEKPAVTELEFYKQGKRYILETIKSPLKGKNGDIIGFFGISRDITCRKLDEEALKTSQHLLKQSEKQSLSGSFEFNSDNQILFCSLQLLKNLGFPESDRQIAFNQFLKRINKAERKIFEVELTRAIHENTDFYMEHRCTRPDQKVIYCKTFIVPDEHGREGIFFGIITDVTKDRQLRKSIIDIQEKERKIIASNLHDSLGQKLVAAKMFLSELRHNDNSEYLPRAIRLIEQSVDEIRSLSKSLSLNAIQGQGLKSSIKDVLDTIPSSVKVDFQMDFDESGLTDEVSTQIYRITQEGVTNILKYARASMVRLLISMESQFLNFMLCDDGIGFHTSSEDQKGNGLRNIRERVARCNGHVDIRSGSTGTSIKIKVPLA